MEKFVGEFNMYDIWRIMKNTFVDSSKEKTIKNEIQKEVQAIYGEHPAFEFPFSNESLTENKIVMGTIIKPR